MHRILVVLLLLPVLAGAAAPDRAGLVHAWEADMGREGTLESVPEGGYSFHSEALGYEGGLRVLNAIVRESRYSDAGAHTQGSVDFELVDLQPAQRDSMALKLWMAERQNFIYDDGRQQWLSTADWARHYADASAGDTTVERLRLNAVTLGFGLFLLVALWLMLQQQRRAQRLIGDSHELNRMARENIEQARELHEAQAQTLGESLDLARHTTQTLDAILVALRSRPQ